MTYGYDDLNRLSTASATAYTRTYTYDEWANLRTVTATGAGETGGYSLSYASNASGAPATNRISTYSYDAAGNVTNDGGTYAYDAANRMKTAGGTNYGFDGDGRRVRVQQGGYSSIYYLWSSVLGQPVAEIVGDTGNLFQAYVYGPGGQMLALLSNDGGFYWSHQDHLGSGRKLTDSTGAVRYRGEFDPHGQVLLEVTAGGTGTYANSHKYTGYEREWSTNLDYAQARMYSHNRARFMQPDPLGIGAADLSSPQTLNRYSYVANDPVSFTDPSGLHVIDPDYWEKNQPSLHGTGLFSPGIHLLGYTNSEGYFNLTGVVVWGGVWGSLGGQTGGGDRRKQAEEKRPCDPGFFIQDENYEYAGADGNVYSANDLNIAGRLVYAESGKSDDERDAVLSVVYNRLGDKRYGGHSTFEGLAYSGQFQAVTGPTETHRAAFERTGPGGYRNLSEADCQSLSMALDAVRRLLKNGPKYPGFKAFRGGQTPLRPGMTLIGHSRFAASDSAFIPPKKRK